MALIGTYRPPLQPGETRPIAADFSGELAVGETLVTPTVTSRNESTNADTSAVFLSAAPSISGGIVTQKVHSGVDGDTHLVKFSVTTSANNVLIAVIRVPVVAI